MLIAIQNSDLPRFIALTSEAPLSSWLPSSNEESLDSNRGCVRTWIANLDALRDDPNRLLQFVQVVLESGAKHQVFEVLEAPAIGFHIDRGPSLIDMLRALYRERHVVDLFGFTGAAMAPGASGSSKARATVAWFEENDQQVEGGVAAKAQIPRGLIDRSYGSANGISAADMDRLRANVVQGVDQHYNFQHTVQGVSGQDSRLHLEVEFVDNPADAHLAVQVHQGSGRANLSNWFVGDAPTVHAHEIGHGAFGLRTLTRWPRMLISSELSRGLSWTLVTTVWYLEP
jgi:hypothetical protein